MTSLHYSSHSSSLFVLYVSRAASYLLPLLRFSTDSTHPVNTKQPPDAYLMHSALIKCFMEASMLPSHLPPAGGVCAGSRSDCFDKRLSFHFQVKSYFYFIFYSAAPSAALACTCRLVLRDPLFSVRMKAILISLPVECAVACTGATADSCSYYTYTYFTTFLLCVFSVYRCYSNAKDAKSCGEASFPSRAPTRLLLHLSPPLSFGCKSRTTLPGDESAYSLSCKDE